MTRQPSGSVTFLFSDIEGSTQLLRELGAERYGAALQEHCHLLRAAFARHEGYEVSYEGDSFFVAFASAPKAVAAAEDAQRVLMAHAWPDKSEFRVRIGIHTGRPLLAPPKYVGLDVHRAARIAASGHGGQVLVSAATADALEPGTFELRDLGDHRFKDLVAPERVFQLGQGHFPPIRSLYRTNLPTSATSFLGRERELAEVVSLLRREDARQLTLTGPGGTGKTRLALQAAAEASDHFPDGVFWVPLAALRDSRSAVSALAQALDVTEEPARELIDVLAERLAGRKALVLLDNAEHLLPPLATELARLIAATESVYLLVTSRERLQVRDEHVYPVGTLDEHTGVQLFLERATAAGMPLEQTHSVRMLCASLDQLPLALELAAARAVLFSPEQLLGRLSQRLDLLRGGRAVDARQQTLRATIEWSYDLLSEEEQRLFRSLSVFAGSCTYDAAEEVAAANPDTLQSLLDKSLLRRRDSESGPRFWMLETIRSFAWERLRAEGDENQLYERHIAFLIERAEARPGTTLSLESEWDAMMGAEYENLHAALQWIEARGDGELLARLAAAAWMSLYLHGHLIEARRWLDRALQLGSGGLLRTRLLAALARVAHRQGDFECARAAATEASELLSTGLDETLRTEVLRSLGNALLENEQLEQAAAAYEESLALAREHGNDMAIGAATLQLGVVAEIRGEYDVARDAYRDAIETSRRLEDDYGLAVATFNTGMTYYLERDIGAAERYFVEALSTVAGHDFPEGIVFPLEALALCRADRGKMDEAAKLLGAATEGRRAHGLAAEVAHEATLSPVRERLVREASEALEEGARLTLEEATALALAPSTKATKQPDVERARQA